MTDTSSTLTDAKGRNLRVVKLTILEELDLLEAAGQASEVRRWMMMATMTATVREIDGVPRPFPRTKDEVRKHVAAVGDEGLKAVIEWLNPLAEAGVSEEVNGLVAADQDVAKN